MLGLVAGWLGWLECCWLLAETIPAPQVTIKFRMANNIILTVICSLNEPSARLLLAERASEREMKMFVHKCSGVKEEEEQWEGGRSVSFK